MDNYKDFLLKEMNDSNRTDYSPCGYYLYKKIDNGMIMVTSNEKKGHIFLKNGIIHKIFRTVQTNDIEFKIHSELYEAFSKKTDLPCTIEAPLYYETFKLDNIEHYYYVVKRPNDLGVEAFYDILNLNVDTNYFLDYVDMAQQSYEVIIPIIKKYNVGLSEELVALSKRFRNKLGIYFWTDFKYYTYPISLFYSKRITSLYLAVTILKKNLQHNRIDIELDIKKIMTTAENKWKIMKI